MLDLELAQISAALAGGALIGLAANVLVIFNGRIAGISGILGGLLSGTNRDISWRMAFLCGLIVAPLLYGWFQPWPIVDMQIESRLLIIAGLLVGFGTRLGSGCTSGHGVCGIARLSRRSIVATLVFIGSGMLTVYVMRHLV
jgi:uncharacterized membrane protein YedE/YeeE